MAEHSNEYQHIHENFPNIISFALQHFVSHITKSIFTITEVQGLKKH